MGGKNPKIIIFIKNVFILLNYWSQFSLLLLTNNHDFCLKKIVIIFYYFHYQLVVTALLRIAVNECVIYTRPWIDRQITHHGTACVHWNGCGSPQKLPSCDECISPTASCCTPSGSGTRKKRFYWNFLI